MVPIVAVVVLVYLKNDREFINVLYGSLGDLRSVSSNFFKSLQVFAKIKASDRYFPSLLEKPLAISLYIQPSVPFRNKAGLILLLIELSCLSL